MTVTAVRLQVIMKHNLASLKRPGDKGCIKMTKNGKFQPQLFDSKRNKQRALGSFTTGEAAALALAAANDKIKAGQPIWEDPVLEKAERGMVRRMPSTRVPRERTHFPH